MDETEVFSGETELSDDLWRHHFEPMSGRFVTLEMTAPNSDNQNWLSLYEARFFSPFPRRPRVSDRECVVTKQSPFDDKAAIDDAIERCSGGGRVIVPAGEYHLNGPIALRSNINLHLEAGAHVTFVGPTEEDPGGFRYYLPPVATRYEGIRIMNYSPLINVTADIVGDDWLPDPDAPRERVGNVAITGNGTLDGGSWGSNWTRPEGGALDSRDRKTLRAISPGERASLEITDWEERTFGRSACEQSVPYVLNSGDQIEHPADGNKCLLRPQMIQFFGADSVLVEDITITNCPFWCLHAVYSSNVMVRNVKIRSTVPNNDGIDIDSSTDVLIENIRLETGDDGIAIKSGRNADGRNVALSSENVLIRRLKYSNVGGGGVLAIGSEMSGGVRGVISNDGHACGGTVSRGVRVKSNEDRGGVISDIRVQGMRFSRVSRELVALDLKSGAGALDAIPDVLPCASEVTIEDITATNIGSPYVRVEGYPNETRVSDVYIDVGVEDKEPVRNGVSCIGKLNDVTVFLNDELGGCD